MYSKLVRSCSDVLKNNDVAEFVVNNYIPDCVDDFSDLPVFIQEKFMIEQVEKTSDRFFTVNRRLFGKLHSVQQKTRLSKPACINRYEYYSRYDWFKNGKMHRAERDPDTKLTLPARVFGDFDENGNEIIDPTKGIWFQNNNIHRDDVDANGYTLPAEKTNFCEIWMLHGKLHRTDRDPITGLVLPASIEFLDEDHKTCRMTWNLNDKMHRDDVGSDGLVLPAFDSPKKQEWRMHGKLHRTDVDKTTGLVLPARIINCGDNEYEYEWYTNGKLSRTDKDSRGFTLPALKHLNLEIWAVDGQYHRTDVDSVTGLTLPAYVDKDDQHFEWWQYGKLHRTDLENGLHLPALTNKSKSIWAKNGVRHRDDIDKNGKTLPAYIDNDTHREEWWKNGQLHNDNVDGFGDLLPAIIEPFANHPPWTEYYIDGIIQQY